MSEGKKSLEAAVQIFEIIRELPSPRLAAGALALAHVLLLEADGTRTESDARIRAQQSSSFVLQEWRRRHGLPAEGAN